MKAERHKIRCMRDDGWRADREGRLKLQPFELHTLSVRRVFLRLFSWRSEGTRDFRG